MNYIKQIIVAMFIITGTINAASFCSLAKNSITPEGYREVGEVININFALENTSTTPCPAVDQFNLPNMSINIDLDKLTPELVGGVPNVSGAILDYFDVVYDDVKNELNLIQKADVPGQTSNEGTFFVEVTAPSIEAADAPNIGYIANLSSIEANTQATNSVENFTLTKTHPSLEVTKTADTSNVSDPVQAGNLILYNFSVTNTGDATLSDVTVTDARINKTVSVGNIDVNETVTAQTFYFITAADIAEGSIINTAIATGKDIQDRNATGSSVNPEDSNCDDVNSSVGCATVTVLVEPITTASTAVDDNETGVAGQPVTLATLDNDTDPEGDINASTVNITTPGATDTDLDGDNDSLVVPNEGTWTVDDTTGDITFTPEPTFTGDPTPINYNVTDDANLTSNDATETIDYPNALIPADDNETGVTGTPTTVDVLANDTGDNPLDPASVKIVDPTTGNPVDTLDVPGEGTWTVDPSNGAITFTPEPTFTGDPTPIEYTVADEEGTVSDPATVTVDYPNPVEATDDNATGTPGDPVVVDVLANDTGDNPLDPASVKIVDPTTGNPVDTLDVPGEGTWTVDPSNGAITFTPEPTFTGDPTPIEYTVADEEGTVSDPATVTVDYPNPVEATDDNATGTPGDPVVVDVLANDTGDNPLDPASVKIVDPTTGNPVDTLDVPGEGTWTVDPSNGAITFTPEPTFTGDPTPIEYTVADEEGTVSDPATVTVDYPNPVEATDDNATGTPGDPVVVDVLANDTGDNPLDPASVKIVDPTTGNPVDTLDVPGEGTWTVDPSNGAITFTPEPTFTGDPTPIEYTVADEEGTVSDPATVTVDYPNPVEATDDNATGTPGDPVVVDVLANDTGDNPLDPASVKIVDPTTGNPVDTLDVPGEGTWTVDPSNGAITFTPEPTFTGDPTPIEYTVADEEGTVSDPATVTVDYPNPVEATDDNATGTPGDPVVVDVLANDTGDNPLDPASVKIVDPTTGNPVDTLDVPGEGTWTVDPSNGAITFTPEPTFTGDPTPIEYTVADEEGTVSDPATVTVDYPNPVEATDDNATGTPGDPVVVDVLANDTGDNPLDPASVKIVDPTTGNPVDTLDVPGEGTWTVDPSNGAITFTPEPTFTGDPTPIEYTVADEEGTVSDPATVTVDYPNPVEATDDNATGTPGDPVVVDVLANDTGDNPLDPASVKIVDPTTGNPVDTLDVPGEGTWTVDPSNGAITFTPEPTFTGDPTPIEYTVADEEGTVSDPATVTVDYPNPVEATDDNATGTPGDPVVVDVLANDTGDNPLDPASVKIVDPTTGNPVDTLDVPGEGTWTVDPSNGAITFTPEPTFTGDPTPIEYTVADEEGTVSDPATVTVDYPNPVEATDDNATGTPGDPVVVDVLANDTGDNPLDPASVKIVDPTTGNPVDTLDVPGEGTWTVDPSNGAITFTPEPTFTGDPTPIEYTVADEEGTVSDPATVTVDYPNPVEATDDNATGTPGDPVVVDVLANDTGDNPLDPASVKIVDPTTGNPVDTLDVPGEGTWTVDPSNGAITFTPEPTFTGDPTPIEYTVADEEGTVSDPATVTVDYAQIPEITITKEGRFNDVDADGNADVNETITYTFVVSNTGNVDLTNVTVIDDNAEVSGMPIDLVVGESDTDTFTAVHIITLQDLMDREVLNQATATATDPSGNDVNGTSDDPTTDPAEDPTILPMLPTPPTSEKDVQDVANGDDAVIDVVNNDTAGAFPLDPASVTLTEPTNATNVQTDTNGDIIGFIVPGEGTWSVNDTTGVVTFSPEDGYVGDPTPVEYTVKDTQGYPTTSEIDINYPPVANNDSNSSLTEGEIAILHPLENDQQTSTEFDPASLNLVVPEGAKGTDTDGDGDIDQVVVPNEGVWTANPDGTVTFDPDGGLIDNPTPIGYVVNEVGGDVSNEATLSVIYVTLRPIARVDTLLVTHYGSNVGSVIENDSAGIGLKSEHTYQLITVKFAERRLEKANNPTEEAYDNVEMVAPGTTIDTEHGTVSMELDGTYTYAPEPNYSGPDEFDYVIVDTIGQKDPAVVDVDVNCASTQTSDSGESLGMLSMIMLMLLTIMTGLYFARNEEMSRKKRKEA